MSENLREESLLSTEDGNQKRMLAVYLTIPFVLAIPPVLGWFIGEWLDGKLNTKPFLSYALIVLGFIAGFKELFRIIRRFGNGV
ncbi:MAG: hypothetical protein CK425_12785 [Parachlamydia sp.]|nr:MAG: hypothetical protein CK425_12785 [Parachlamydia sp.]